MSDLFLFGTLVDAALFEIVADCAPDHWMTTPAMLPGVAAQMRALDGAAGLVPGGPGVAGKVVHGVGPGALSRMRYYAQVLGMEEKCVSVTGADADITAICFDVPETTKTPWSCPDWTARHRDAAIRAAGEIMAHRAQYDAAQMQARLTPIRMRAAAWARARTQAPDPVRDPDRDVVLHAHHRPYMNFFSVHEVDLQFRRNDGALSPVINRGALIMGEAAVVLPYDPRRDAALLIEQFRAPLYMGGARNPWIWEPIAGLVDPGETAQDTAHREAMEEAGLTLDHLEPMGQMYSSTGNLSDYLNLFIGLSDLSDIQTAGGLASEGEDIQSQVISFDALMAGVDAQRFPDMPLVTMALWLSRHRDRLRAMA